MNDQEYQELYEQLETECKKYNYTVCKNLHMIKITSKFEHWYIEIKGDGKIKLMHLKDRITSPGMEYHKHFCRQISISDLVLYIHEHELAKYSGKIVPFHFTKDGRRIGKEKGNV